MAEEKHSGAGGFAFPSAFTILFALIIIMAAATWIVPAGQYERTTPPGLGREVAVAGSYRAVEANPQGPAQVLMAPVEGFYDPQTETTRAIDVVLFVLFIGGFMGVVAHTGAMDAAIAGAMRRLRGREIWMIDGARDLLGVALIIGLARGVLVVMDDGRITDTILHAGEGAVAGLSSGVFITMIFALESAMTLIVPSSSGHAVLTMPILAPLGDFAGVERALVVTAYQAGNGVVSLFTPTSAVLMGSIAIGRVPFDRWLRFVLPLALLVTLACAALLAGAAALT